MKRAPSLVALLLNLIFIGLIALSGVVASAQATELTDFSWLLANPSRAELVEVWILLLILVAFAGMPLLTVSLAARDLYRGLRWQGILSGGVSAALFLVLALWIGLGGSFASYQEAQVSRAWGATLDPMDTFTSRYAEAPASDAALQLAAAAAHIGVDLVPYGVPGTRPAETDSKTYEAIRKGLFGFVTSQTENASEILEAPPADVAAWHSAHTTEVTALVRLVLHNGPIVLETDWERYESPLPNLQGLRGIVSVLILHGLEKERGGDSRAALDAFEASWRIGGALRDRGELISQLVAVGLDGITLEALRKVNDVRDPWRERIAEHDYLISMLRAFEGEAWQFSARVTKLPAMDPRRPLGERLWLPLEGPYMRLMASNHSETVRRIVAELKETDPCLADPSERVGRAEKSIAWWNFLGRITIPSFARPWRSAVGTALEVELTQRVLAARTLKRKGENWPADMPAVSSAVCRGAKWIYSTSNDGSVSLSLSQEPTYGRTLAFRSRPRSQSRTRLTPIVQAPLR